MTIINMSEFKEEHKVSLLMGSPPGYVGYGEGGVLTEAVRRRPYSVVLLDEMEKANPAVFDIFLQLFDDGRLTDGQGRVVDAKNAIFIMTSTIASDMLSRKSVGFVNVEEEDATARVRSVLGKTFREEFLDRIDEIIVFDELGRDAWRAIAKLRLQEFSDRLAEEHGMSLSWTDEVTETICEKGYGKAEGARSVRRTIEQLIAKPLSSLILQDEVGGKVEANVSKGKIVFS